MTTFREIRPHERLVSRLISQEDLRGGDIMAMRKAAYGCGYCQMLFVAYVDGFGGTEPKTFKVYAIPEFMVIPIDWDGDLKSARNMRVESKDFTDCRNNGNLVPEDEAKLLFPQLAYLPYDL